MVGFYPPVGFYPAFNSYEPVGPYSMMFLLYGVFLLVNRSLFLKSVPIL